MAETPLADRVTILEAKLEQMETLDGRFRAQGEMMDRRFVDVLRQIDRRFVDVLVEMREGIATILQRLS